MAVKVTLNDGAVESFDGADDEFSERKDGKLEVHRADGTTKVYAAGLWSTVDGKKKKPARPMFA